MCKPHLFQTQCVCKSCGRDTAPSRLVVFPDDRCDQLPTGTQAEDCPFLDDPPPPTVLFAGLHPSPFCKHTVRTQLKNSTITLFDSLQTVSNLVQSEARTEFDGVDAARARLRFSLRNLKEALAGDGDLPRAQTLLEEVSSDAVMIQHSSERWENVRERISSLLQSMVDDAHSTRDRAAALLEERPSPIPNRHADEGDISDGSPTVSQCQIA
ncbi:uncharacterized protein PG998_012675 [Apiospora kogelbergensis]|uniref:Uncharacterized protein n=1 Tax=Apiospora kogelbergensis TaxID=1337665 RepID=A0AAW0Q9J2_9PEZI